MIKNVAEFCTHFNPQLSSRTYGVVLKSNMLVYTKWKTYSIFYLKKKAMVLLIFHEVVEYNNEGKNQEASGKKYRHLCLRYTW